MPVAPYPQRMEATAPDPADTAAAFRAAMRRVASTVHVVTIRVDDTPMGMTATAVSSLALTPPSLLVCVNQSARMHSPMADVRRFCVNVLGREQTDVARAFADALVLPQAAGGTFNIGSGRDRSVTEVATELARAMGKNDIAPQIVGKARIGDIRHCFCDTSFAAEKIGFTARRDFQAGLTELAEWLAAQTAHDRVDQMRAELETRGLVA